MKNNSICDDRLVSSVAKELAKIGLIVPVSEIEQTAIRVYDDIKTAHSLVEGIATIDCRDKDDRYYNILLNIVCADIIARARLEHVTDAYEATSVLSLLQKYLDGLSKVAQTEKHQAPVVFQEILSKLPISITVDSNGNGWSVRTPKHKGGSPNGTTPMANESSQDSDEVPSFIKNLAANVLGVSPDDLQVETIRIGRDREKAPGPKICSTCDKCHTGECDGCDACNDTDCENMVRFSVAYRNQCFGVVIDPGVIGLELQKITKRQYKSNITALKASLKAAAKMLSERAEEIFNLFRKEYEEYEDD